jgi:HPt (histidine-containing phosphotransfer) domain-containing protein
LSEAESQSSPLRGAAIERLGKLGGPKFAAEMIALFLSYGEERITATRLALQAGNLDGVAEAAHPLKSSAGNVGALRVQELAASIEQFAKAGNTAALSSQVGELERAFAEVKVLLEAEKGRLRP